MFLKNNNCVVIVIQVREESPKSGFNEMQLYKQTVPKPWN